MVFGALRSSEQSHQGFRKRVGTPFLNENDGNIRKQWSSVVIEESWNPDVLASYGTLAGGIGIKPCKIKPWFQHVWFFKYVTCVCVCVFVCVCVPTSPVPSKILGNMFQSVTLC